MEKRQLDRLHLRSGPEPEPGPLLPSRHSLSTPKIPTMETPNLRIVCRYKPGQAGILSYRVYVGGHPAPRCIEPGWYKDAEAIIRAFSEPLRHDLQDLIRERLKAANDVEFPLEDAFQAACAGTDPQGPKGPKTRSETVTSKRRARTN